MTSKKLSPAQRKLLAEGLRVKAPKAKRRPRKAAVPLWSEYQGRELDFLRDVVGLRAPDGVDGVALWAGQRSMIRRTFEPGARVLVRSGRKAGKTHGIAFLALAAVLTRPCVVLIVSSTLANIRNVIFDRMAKAHQSSRTPLPGEVRADSYRLEPGRYVVGCSFGREGSAQGFHGGTVCPDNPDAMDMTDDEVRALIEKGVRDGSASELFIVIDEAAEVDERVIASLEGSMSGPNVHVLLTGNPTIGATSSHQFARYGMPGSRFHRIKVSHVPESERPDPISADEVFDQIPPWVVGESGWPESQAHSYGETSAHYAAYVLGQYADLEASSRVIPSALLLACSSAENVPEPIDHLGVGIDIADTKDSSVAVLVAGGVVRAVHEWRSPGEDESGVIHAVDEIQALIPRWEREFGVRIPHRSIHLDKGGVGAGTVGRLRQVGMYVDGVQFGESATGGWQPVIGRFAYYNRRAELHWTVRRLMQERKLLIPDTPANRKLREELLWSTWTTRDFKGEAAILLDPKDHLRKLHGRSPDHADALALALCRPRGLPTFETWEPGATRPRVSASAAHSLEAPGWEPFRGFGS